MDRAGATPKSAAGRTACINIRALPLQLLLRSHPQWREKPVAVVEEEKPLSPILWLNAAAVRGGVRPGMKYAAALSLDRDLCAGTVSEEEAGAAVRQVHGALDRFSPRVEPSGEEPGIFWVDAGGLDWLYESLEDWAGQMHAALSALELSASVVVGFGRFGAYAVAKARNGVVVLPTMEAEESASRKVRLLDLRIEPKLRGRLDKLAVYTVGDFLALPGERIARHLGEQARALYRFAAGDRSLPLQPRGLPEPLRARMELDANETDARGLRFRVSQLLAPLLKAAGERYQAAAALRLTFRQENGERRRCRVQAAEPTLDARLLLELVGLRLETVSFPFPPVELALEVEGVGVTADKLNLLQENPDRDRGSAMRALARVRAEFGPDSVLTAGLASGHLPEARFAWRPFGKLAAACPRPVAVRALVRRAHARPRILEGQPVNWQAPSGPGPPPEHLVSGGWWIREVRRDYRFVDTARGETLWIYYDHGSGRWYVQGRVE